jgi:hypothetical protein
MDLSIFICYRREDLTFGVDKLAETLKSHFGEHAVCVDREAFYGGLEWAAQNRALIGKAHLIICAIGPTWIRRPLTQPKQSVDYIVEELKLARSLGKKILPVRLAEIDIKSIKTIFPKLKWFQNIHITDGTGILHGDNKPLINSIENLLGRRFAHGKQISAPSLWARAVSALGESFVRPAGVAASLMSPTHQAWEVTWRLYVVSLVIGLICFGYRSTITVDTVITYAVNTTLSVLFVFASFSLTAILVRSPVPFLTRLNFSFHSLAVATVLANILITIIWSAIGHEYIGRLQAETWEQFAYNVQEILQEIGNRSVLIWTGVGIVSINSYINWLTWSFIRAASLITMWRWRTIALAFVLFIFASWMGWAYNAQSNPPSNLIKFSYVNAVDTITTEGLMHAPLQISANGTIEVNEGKVYVEIEHLLVKNDTDEVAKGLIHCWLFILQNGKLIQKKPVPISRDEILTPVPPHSNWETSGISLTIPLPNDYVSGQTGLMMEVWNNGKAISINAGRDEVLYWRKKKLFELE